MFDCYVDDASGSANPPHRIVSCTALLGSADGRARFDRRWKFLLLKHDLPALQLGAWRQMAKAKGWDAARRHAVAAEFAMTIDEQDMLGFSVAVDTMAWRSLASKRRKSFGTEREFCFLRVIRLVFDRLEAANCADTVRIDFSLDPSEFERRSNAVQRLLRLDSRASPRVASIQFEDPERRGQLQAAHLLTGMIMRSQIAHAGEEQIVPAWLTSLKELPEPPSGLTLEYWNRAYTNKHFSNIEWLMSEATSR